MLNLLSSMAMSANQQDNAGVQGEGAGPFERFVSFLSPYIPAISDVFLTIAVIALVVCFGMLTVAGQQKVQQIKGHLLRIMLGAAGVLAAAYIVGFFARAGGTKVGGGGYQAGVSGQTIAPAKFYLARIFPSLM